MTIKLPVMNYLAQRWNLPSTIVDAADFYQLRRMSCEELDARATYSEGKGSRREVIHEAGIEFDLVFQKGAELYRFPEYWVSFRSLTFEFQGKLQTKSFALVQPVLDKKGSVARRASASVQSAETPESQKTHAEGTHAERAKPALMYNGCGAAKFLTFAERSLPREEDSEESWHDRQN